MDIKEYDFSRITNIDFEGVTYIDDLGSNCFIDFNECRRNWMKIVNNTKEYNRHELSEKYTKCVGERDISSNPKYFVFYGNPTVKFIFSCKDSIIVRLLNQSKSIKNFQRVQYAIKSSGWSTYDLS